jgi:hypothetical protein
MHYLKSWKHLMMRSILDRLSRSLTRDTNLRFGAMRQEIVELRGQVEMLISVLNPANPLRTFDASCAI